MAPRNASHFIQRSPNTLLHQIPQSSTVFLFCYFDFTFLCRHFVTRNILSSSHSAEQTLDGVGTESDDLALKREEEKQRMKDTKKRFENLPNDGGEEIIIRFLSCRNETGPLFRT